MEGALIHVNELIVDLAEILDRLHGQENRLADQAHAEVMAQVDITQEYVTDLMVEVGHATINANAN